MYEFFKIELVKSALINEDPQCAYAICLCRSLEKAQTLKLKCLLSFSASPFTTCITLGTPLNFSGIQFLLFVKCEHYYL